MEGASTLSLAAYGAALKEQRCKIDHLRVRARVIDEFLPNGC